MRIVQLADTAVRPETPGRLGVWESGSVALAPPGWDATGALAAPELFAAAVKDHGSTRSATTAELTIPLDRVRSLRDCVGFLDHVRNCRRARNVLEDLPPAWSRRPAFYFANPASLHAHAAPVAIPPACRAFDFEFEIGAVIGRAGQNLSAVEAAKHIAGYVLYCDWSARDIQAEERTMQIGQGKGKDGAITLGPWIMTGSEADALRRPDGFDFNVSVTVNDTLILRAAFTGMNWTFEELVAYASHGASIEPGDIIASGTLPGGCLLEASAEQNFRGWLTPGDVVTLDGGPLGAIRAAIAEPVTAPAWRQSKSPTLTPVSA